MPSGDVYIINPPKDPSWISVASQWASTWLWEHSDLIPLLLSEVLLAAVIVAIFHWWEHRKTVEDSQGFNLIVAGARRVQGIHSPPGGRLNPRW